MSIRNQIAKLIDVKSIITITLTATLIIATLNGAETSELFEYATMLVLGFFFGKKTGESTPQE